MATFGDTSSGANNEGCTTDRALVDLATLSEAATVTGIWLYCGAHAASTTNYKGLILSNNAGAPENVLIVGSPVLITGTGWFRSPATGDLSADDYWIGLVADNFTANVGSDASGDGTDIKVANGNFSYSSPPSTWPVSGDFYTVARQLNVYVEYSVPGSARRTFGVPGIRGRSIFGRGW